MNLLTKKDSSNTAQTTTRGTVRPRYTVRETADAFVVTAHVPGVDRSSVETTVHGENLTVLARRNWSAPSHWTPVHQEISPADYRLVLELDHRFNSDGVKAELSQGVLTLTVPKAEQLKPRRIEIQG